MLSGLSVTSSVICYCDVLREAMFVVLVPTQQRGAWDELQRAGQHICDEASGEQNRIVVVGFDGTVRDGDVQQAATPSSASPWETQLQPVVDALQEWVLRKRRREGLRRVHVVLGPIPLPHCHPEEESARRTFAAVMRVKECIAKRMAGDGLRYGVTVLDDCDTNGPRERHAWTRLLECAVVSSNPRASLVGSHVTGTLRVGRYCSELGAEEDDVLHVLHADAEAARCVAVGGGQWSVVRGAEAWTMQRRLLPWTTAGSVVVLPSSRNPGEWSRRLDRCADSPPSWAWLVASDADSSIRCLWTVSEEDRAHRWTPLVSIPAPPSLPASSSPSSWSAAPVPYAPTLDESIVLSLAPVPLAPLDTSSPRSTRRRRRHPATRDPSVRPRKQRRKRGSDALSLARSITAKAAERLADEESMGRLARERTSSAASSAASSGKEARGGEHRERAVASPRTRSGTGTSSASGPLEDRSRKRARPERLSTHPGAARLGPAFAMTAETASGEERRESPPNWMQWTVSEFPSIKSFNDACLEAAAREAVLAVAQGQQWPSDLPFFDSLANMVRRLVKLMDFGHRLESTTIPVDRPWLRRLAATNAAHAATHADISSLEQRIRTPGR